MESNKKFVGSREAMDILSIKSLTTLGSYITNGIIKAYTPFNSNRRRFKVSELEKVLNSK
jgi:predicted site-specific integrase-resolvase